MVLRRVCPDVDVNWKFPVVSLFRHNFHHLSSNTPAQQVPTGRIQTSAITVQVIREQHLVTRWGSWRNAALHDSDSEIGMI